MKLFSGKKVIMKIALVTVLIFIVTGLIGCTEKPIQYGYVDQESTIEELNIKGTIKFTVNNESGTEAESMAPRGVVNAFMQAFPNTKVQYEEASRSTYPTRISAGDIGDVFWCDSNDTVNYHSVHNALMPLDSYIKPMNIDLGDVYTGAIDAGKIDGRLYMVPRKIGISVLIYNCDIIQAAGVDFDNTVAYDWEDFKALCKQLTIEENGQIIQVGASMKLGWAPVWQMFMRGYGGKWIDNKEHRVSITDSTEVMAGINEMVNAVQEGWLYPEDLMGSISGSLKDKFSKIPDGDSNVSSACFKTFNNMTWLTRLGTAYDRMKIDWNFCPFPAFPTHNVSTDATGYVVYNRTTNPDTAAAFALFFLTEAGQHAYHSQTGSSVPLLKTLADETFWYGPGTEWTDKNYKVFVSYTDCTQPCFVSTQAPREVADIITSNIPGALGRIFSGSVDVQTALEKIQTQANEKWLTILT
ncbi:MAG: extracellular solute-binding protein [Clostridia bacterium]|nr:extracellular solute-binding protein [Clostridia bacterium]MBP5780206.1 extracellular solute-binding protein [Clostridia bacterium]